MSDNETVRKASLPAGKGGMTDTNLRHYNSQSLLSGDPVYSTFPELREKMENRTLPFEKYMEALGTLNARKSADKIAAELYTDDRIRLLTEVHQRDLRSQREAMFRRDHSRAPVIVHDGNTFVHPPIVIHPFSRYGAH